MQRDSPRISDQIYFHRRGKGTVCLYLTDGKVAHAILQYVLLELSARSVATPQLP